jgi:DNA-binding NarL/FixJ family response regulator
LAALETDAQSADDPGMKLLIVDDHAVVREGLAAVLRQAEEATLVLQAEGSLAGLDLAEKHADLDAIFLDLKMPGLGGMAAIQEFGRRRPDVPVIVLSSSEDTRDVQNALAAGALGYVPKSANRQTLLTALKLVLSGEVYLPPLLLAQIRAGASLRGHEPRTRGVAGLTDRQREVLRLIAEGRSNKDIGNTLGLSEKTVKAHVTAIFRTLDVVNRTQAAGEARKAGLL